MKKKQLNQFEFSNDIALQRAQRRNILQYSCNRLEKDMTSMAWGWSM